MKCGWRERVLGGFYHNGVKDKGFHKSKDLGWGGGRGT